MKEALCLGFCITYYFQGFALAICTLVSTPAAISVHFVKKYCFEAGSEEEVSINAEVNKGIIDTLINLTNNQTTPRINANVSQLYRILENGSKVKKNAIPKTPMVSTNTDL